MAAKNNEHLTVGEVVELQNLQSSGLNGRLGVVQKFHEDQGRYEIVSITGLGNQVLGVKPENLTQKGIIKPSDPQFSSLRKFQHVVFWPRPKSPQGKRYEAIPVHAFADWPEDWDLESEIYLEGRLGWKDPQEVGGVESRGSALSDFTLFFDAGNRDSPVNTTAVKILSLLPEYKLNTLPPECMGITPRGTCVLRYSPTRTSTFGSHMPGGNPANITAGNADRLFSLQQLLETVLFQETKEARRQYEEHDDPMYRVFGGMF